MQIKHSVTVNSQKKSRKTLLIGIKRLKRVASLSCQFEMTRNLQKAKLSQEKKYASVYLQLKSEEQSLGISAGPNYYVDVKGYLEISFKYIHYGLKEQIKNKRMNKQMYAGKKSHTHILLGCLRWTYLLAFWIGVILLLQSV